MANYGQSKSQLDSNPAQHNADLSARDKPSDTHATSHSPKRAGKFELYEDDGGQWRFRLKAGNGEVIAVSEGYTTKEGARGGIDSVRRNARTTRIVEV